MDRATIASRATTEGRVFYKSYIRDIKQVERRPIQGHKRGWEETDYTFTYRGKSYRVNEYIVPNEQGEVIYSAKYRYELIEL